MRWKGLAMRDFKSRIRRLEEERAVGSAGLLETLLRLFNREGTMRAAVASLETERGRPLKADPAFVRAAELTALRIQDQARQMREATDGSAREAGRS